MFKIRKGKRYSKKFRYEAARLIVEEGRPLEEVAKELGIEPKKLLQWQREYHRVTSLSYMNP